MKILHTGMGWFSEDAGGLSRYMSQALVAQSAAGHHVAGLVTGTPAVEALSGGLAKAFAGRNDRMDKRLAGLRRSFRGSLDRMDPDVATFHFALYGRGVLRMVRNRPWVMHFHGPWALEGRAEGASAWSSWIRHNLVERAMYRAAPRVVTLSRCFADILRKEFGVSEERIRIVPGGFDPTPFLAAPSRTESRARLGFDPDRPLLVCVRRLASRMGLENLIDAIGILKEKHPGIRLAIAGKGPRAGALAERIREAGLEEHIRLLGFVPDEQLPLLYAAADLSVVPTVSLEGFGLIVAESLASGTPVVASRVGALPELLNGFSENLLSEPTAQGLAEVVDRALTDRGSLPGIDACRAHSSRWSWAQVTPRLIEVYNEAIEMRRS